MLVIKMDDFNVGDVQEVRINGTPRQLWYQDDKTLTILTMDTDEVISERNIILQIGDTYYCEDDVGDTDIPNVA